MCAQGSALVTSFAHLFCDSIDSALDWGNRASWHRYAFSLHEAISNAKPITMRRLHLLSLVCMRASLILKSIIMNANRGFHYTKEARFRASQNLMLWKLKSRSRGAPRSKTLCSRIFHAIILFLLLFCSRQAKKLSFPSVRSNFSFDYFAARTRAERIEMSKSEKDAMRQNDYRLDKTLIINSMKTNKKSHRQSISLSFCADKVRFFCPASCVVPWEKQGRKAKRNNRIVLNDKAHDGRRERFWLYFRVNFERFHELSASRINLSWPPRSPAHFLLLSRFVSLAWRFRLGESLS